MICQFPNQELHPAGTEATSSCVIRVLPSRSLSLARFLRTFLLLDDPDAHTCICDSQGLITAFLEVGKIRV
jgi:hypothetical protein